jgi:hydroxyacylglutathione hydrolase
MTVIAIDIPELGNRSYLIHDGTVAIVVDPSRRTQQITDIAKAASVSIAAVFETHIHNDYVTGGYTLSRKLNIPYYVSAHDHVHFEREKIDHEQTVTVGKLSVTALASPGHTSHHLSYLVEQTAAPAALFSGGSLLYGAVGRTDLVSAEDTLPLARAQYQTARFFVDRLQPSTVLYPTHGFGSFCAATDTENVALSTIAQQLKSNQVYTAKDESSFVEELVSGLDAYPAYYAYMASANLKGPLSPSLDAPAQLTKEAVMQAMHTGAAIIDMRSRTAYAAKHTLGTYNIELSDDLATYVGWLIEWDAPLILVASSAREVAQAQEQLSLIGRDVIAGKIQPAELLKDPTELGLYPVRSFVDLAAALPTGNVLVLDVRRKLEWQKGHIPKAVHIPLHELRTRLTELSGDREIWIHCASGFRASIAASILSGAGNKVVLINDNYTNVRKAGLLPIHKQKFVDDIAKNQAQLLDVRDNSEWKDEHAKGATHIPLGQLLDGDTASLIIEKPVYVYCEMGERSGMAASFLNGQGFSATNIGGLTDWVQAGGTIER